MKNAALFIRALLNFRNLGVCPLCMRMSFLAMASSWLLFFGAKTLNADATAVIATVSVAFTILWLAHIGARALRSLPPKELDFDARRGALRALGRAIVGAAAVSVALISVTQTARAECGSACSRSNTSCSSGCTCWWELGKCVKLN